jgi:hypothetical protein
MKKPTGDTVMLILGTILIMAVTGAILAQLAGCFKYAACNF